MCINREWCADTKSRRKPLSPSIIAALSIQELQLTAEVCALLKTWGSAFKAGSEVELRAARANLS